MLKSKIYPILYRLALLYWFVFRPKTTGTKVIITSGDHLLLILNTYGPDNWTLVGGGPKAGESPEQTVRREAWEEVGLELPGLQYLGSFETQTEYKHDTVYVFRCEVDQKWLDLDQVEIKKAKWFKITNLPPLASSITRTCLKLAQIPM